MITRDLDAGHPASAAHPRSRRRRRHCASFSEIDRDRQRPGEPEPRVVVREPALGLGSVELADLVARLRLVHERLVAVREALGDVQRPPFSSFSSTRHALQVRRALRAEVDDDVDDGAAGARTIFVSAAGGNWKCIPRSVPAPVLKATFAWAITGLRPCSASSCWQKLRAKKPALVLAPLQVDHEGAVQRGLGEDHVALLLAVRRRHGFGVGIASRRSSASMRPASISVFSRERRMNRSPEKIARPCPPQR